MFLLAMILSCLSLKSKLKKKTFEKNLIFFNWHVQIIVFESGGICLHRSPVIHVDSNDKRTGLSLCSALSDYV